MRQQDAGAIPVYSDLSQHFLKMLVRRGVIVRYANDLQLIRVHFLVVQHAHSRIANRLQVSRIVAELFMVASNEIRAVRRAQIAPDPNV